VDYSKFLHIFDTLNDLLGKLLSMVFRDSSILVISLDKFIKIPFFAKFKNDIEVVFGHLGTHKFDDVGMVKVPQNFNFLLDLSFLIL